MSGRLISVIPPTLFDFTNMQPAASSQSWIVASRIDTSGVESGVLQVRVHAISIVGASDTIAVDATLHGYTPDDPGLDFGQVGASIVTGGAISFGTGAIAPLFSTASLAGNFGGQLKITVKGTRVAAAANTLVARLSIDLALKTGGVEGRPMARMPGTYLGYR